MKKGDSSSWVLLRQSLGLVHRLKKWINVHFLLCFFFYTFSLFFFWRLTGEERGGNLLAGFKYTFDWELPIEWILSAKTCRRADEKDGYPILENRHVLLIGWWLGSWPYFHGVIVAVNTKMAHDLWRTLFNRILSTNMLNSSWKYKLAVS